jgi:hypothetical protein
MKNPYRGKPRKIRRKRREFLSVSQHVSYPKLLHETQWNLLLEGIRLQLFREIKTAVEELRRVYCWIGKWFVAGNK